MKNVMKDVIRFNSLIDKIVVPGCGKLYFNSNEMLNDLFSLVDVDNKDVLCVVGSGDQAFHCYQNGAKHVDLFDRNKFSIYYFYLRKWIIQYCDKFYPESISRNYIKKVIGNVVPESDDEKNAYLFWTLFLKKRNGKKITNAFYSRYPYGQVLNEIEDVSTIKRKIDADTISFYHINMAENIEIDDTYDVIITSNIAEYLRSSESKLEIYSDNLYNSLNKNGYVLASNLMSNDIDPIEKRIFERKFEIEKLPVVVSSDRDRKYSLGYKCIKK